METVRVSSDASLPRDAIRQKGDSPRDRGKTFFPKYKKKSTAQSCYVQSRADFFYFLGTAAVGGNYVSTALPNAIKRTNERLVL